MGIKRLIVKAGKKASDKIAKLSVLSPEQLAEVAEKRDAYLNEMPSSNDKVAEELTRRILASNSVEIYNAYLGQLKQLYQPIDESAEYKRDFDAKYNIRYFQITKWVNDKKENSLEKLINVYEVLSHENCNIALVFNRTKTDTQVYLVVTNTNNDDNNVDVDNYIERIRSSVKGNFPGSECSKETGTGMLPCLKNDINYSVATVSNIPTEKSEKFVSQTIEKLLDGIIPANKEQEYTLVLLATPVPDIEERKMRLAEMYSGMVPYATWQKDYTMTLSDALTSMASVGLNAGLNAGINKGINNSHAKGSADTSNKQKTDSHNQNVTESQNENLQQAENKANTETNQRGIAESENENRSESSGESQSFNIGSGSSYNYGEGENLSETDSVSAGASYIVNVNTSNSVTSATSSNESWTTSESFNKAEGYSNNITEAFGNSTTNSTSQSLASTIGSSVAKSIGSSLAKSVGRCIAETIGQAVTKSVTETDGMYKGVNIGGNFGANFARSSNVTATVGKNEGIHQTFVNYTIKHTLELLDEQMKRYETSTALGMWDFAAYVLGEDTNIVNNVAHSYLALTQGETSNMTCASVNLWRGDMGKNSDDAKEIVSYIKEMRHPLFGINPEILKNDPTFSVYPAIVTATTSLSGKELAYSLNFPQKSVSGLPVIECAEFGRNVINYDENEKVTKKVRLGNIFHMNHMEKNYVDLDLNSLASHTFITGSTGSGKSNTVYQIINEVGEKGVKFLIIEPTKGEYKDIFGNESDVNVYSTNPAISQLLKLNPFSFPDGIHVFEHIDRLVEIFNVCWPMYAAMPAVLKNAVQKSYEDCGWDMIKSVNPYGEGLYPCFADVARNVRTIIDFSEYDSENKGAYKGSLLTRLESLANGINGLVFSTDEIKNEILFDENTIIDLSRVGSNETKSLLMGMIVLKLQEYRMVKAIGMNEELKHITVLEEAHNLLKRTSQDFSSESGNLLGKSVEMISNAIAEMRTYGEGFIIADQAPGLLDMSVIRNTNTKIIMRLPDQSDRELVGKSASLNDDQITELSKLPRGVAAVYQNEWVVPVLCKVDKFDYTAGKYTNNQKETNEILIDNEKSISLMELLSDGTSLNSEKIQKEIVPDLDSMKLPSSIKVSIMKMLMNPAKEPRMTKLAPIVNGLFPSVVKSIRETYSYKSAVASDWTQSAEDALIELSNYTLRDQVRRDIIQGAMTYYFLNEISNSSALREWKENGGLR